MDAWGTPSQSPEPLLCRLKPTRFRAEKYRWRRAPNTPTRPAKRGLCYVWRLQMRISSSPDDPSYSPHFHKCRIFVAGSERNNVVTADELGRFALMFRRDEFGAPVTGKDGAQVVERYWGEVRIECEEWLRIAQSHQSNEECDLTAVMYAIAASP